MNTRIPLRNWLRGLVALGFLGLLGACNNSIYVRDGVTDGDTFYLPEYVLYDDDPALQSWVAYSLDLSTCQLQIGGRNPARNSSFDCEFGARRVLLDTWYEKRIQNPTVSDAYLDQLAEVDQAGYLREYVASHFRRSGWALPRDLRSREFIEWETHTLPHHRLEKRIVGSWNYQARNR